MKNKKTGGRSVRLSSKASGPPVVGKGGNEELKGGIDG